MVSDKNLRKNSFKVEVIEAEVTCPEAKLVTPTVKGLRRLFASLAYRDFRYFWSGALLSNMGSWIQAMALGWLVFNLTNSPFLLGFVNFAGSLPVLLFALFAGAAADRLDKKLLIIWTQGILMILAFLLGFLTTSKATTVVNISLIHFGAGIAMAFSFPAWQAIISDIVSGEDLLNAIALNSAQFNLARLVGPAVAGFVLSTWGVAACFYVNGASFLAVIIALLLIAPAEHLKKEEEENVWQHIFGGLRYARDHREVGFMLLTIAVLTIFGVPYSVFMPVFARDILEVGAKGFGMLMAANGLGALLGALMVAYLARLARRDILIKTGILTFSFAIIALAFSKTYWLSLLLLVVIGISLLMSMSSLNTSIQSSVPTEVRGRVMGIFVWAFMGLMPIGSILFGAIAEALSVPLAVAIGGAGCLLMGFFLVSKSSLLGEICG